MKHATDQALNQLEDFLNDIRKLGKLKEKQRGIFYFKAVAFLHFHEDPSGLFADLRQAGEFQRYPVNNAAKRKIFLSKVKSAMEEFLACKE